MSVCVTDPPAAGPCAPSAAAAEAATGGSAQVDAAMARLEAALADLARVELSGVTPQQAGELARRATAARRSMEAVDARLLRRFVVGGVWSVEGFRSPAAWLCGRSNEATGAVYGRLRTAQRCERHALMAAAVAAGAVSVRHVDVVADAHRHYPTLSRALDGIEAELAAYAAEATPEDLRRRLSATLHRIDPDAVDAADARRRDLDAGLQVSTLLDGWGKVDALLPPEIHAKFLAALDAARDALVRHDQPGPRPHSDADPDVEHGPRRRRRLAAFDLLLDAAVAATGEGRLPDVGGTRPVVTIVCEVETALAEPGDGATGMALLPRTRGLVGARTLHRLLCDAAVRRMVVDPAGHVLDVGRTTRAISPHLRAAIEARDQWRCRFPGCRDPIHEIHHVVPWSQGGPTDRANLVGVCWHHHRVIHEPGWLLSGDADEQITVRLDGLDGETWVSPAPGLRV